MEKIKALGAYPSAPDYRDEIVAAAAGSTPGFMLPISINTDLGPVMDQNKMPACVSHSIVYLMKLYWFHKTGKWIDFSPRFLDILSEQPWIPLDGGRDPRTVLRLAKDVGCCTTALLPNDTEFLTLAQYRDPKVITQAMRDEAAKYKIPGFIRIALDPVSTRKGLALYGALTATYLVGEEMWVPSWQPKDTDPLRLPKTVVSGHQMAPRGYKNLQTTLNTVRNQWSKDWSDKGDSEYDPILWRNYMTEQWAIAEIPADLVDFLKTLPSPSNFTYTWTKYLQQGDVNDDVKWLQVALMILGYLAPVVPENLGIYGPKTAAAVTKFQAANKIAPIPGSVGPKTRLALNTRFS